MGLIYPKSDGRLVVPTRVNALAQSFQVMGLQTPITVRPTQRIRDGRPTDAFEIIAGRHRFEAAKAVGWGEINAFVMDGSSDDAELWEIEENFNREELTDAQRADHHVRREAILVRRGAVSAPGRGGDRTSNEQIAHSYSKQTAADLGVHESTVRRDLARGKKIDPEVLAAVSGTPQDKGVVLDQLAATPREEQAAKLVVIREQRSAVRPAPDPLNDPEAHERQLAALMAAWNRAAGIVRQEFMLRIDLPVFDVKMEAA